jgi:hypothetical protein
VSGRSPSDPVTIRFMKGAGVPNLINTVLKRLLLLCGCSVGAAILLVREFSGGTHSPREYGIALLMLCVGIGAGAILVIRKSSQDFAESPVSPGTPIETDTRKQLLRRIRRARIRIVAMAIVLVLGFGSNEIRSAPAWAILVAVAINLLITARSIQTILRLQRILGGWATSPKLDA